MALQGQNANTPGGSQGGQTETAMGAALSRATQAAGGSNQQSQPPAAPAHPTMNVGSGRNPGQDTQSDVGRRFSYNSMTAGHRLMMTRERTSEVITNLAKAISEIYENKANKDFEYTLIPIDKNVVTVLAVSVLVVCVRDKMRPKHGVAFYALILEGSTDPFQPRTETMPGGKVIEIIDTAGGAYDDIMKTEIKNRVAAAFPGANMYDAEATVVPRDFDISKTELVQDLAANAAFACSQELEVTDPNFSDFNLANAAGDATLMVRTTFENNETSDLLGQPVRSDIVIDFTSAPQKQNQQSQNQQSTKVLSRLAGFMDIIWDAPQQLTGFGPMPSLLPGLQPAPGWGQPQQNYQRYLARFVLTLLDSTQLLTIGAQLLALLQALTLRDSNNWIYAFKPRQLTQEQIQRGEPDLHDIGAINYEANLQGDPSGVGGKFETHSSTFGELELRQLIAATFKPGMVMSLDVPECGPSSWYNSVFAAAAAGSQGAIRAILEAANVLTNGNFNKLYDPANQLCTDESNRIHLGYYTDKQGVRHDIREIDYLAVLNMQGHIDVSVVKDWSDTFLQTKYPIAQRLSERMRVMRHFIPNLQVTGYARRVTFNPKFMDALANAAAQAGLSVRPVISAQDITALERASGGFLNNYVLGGDVQTQVFARGGYGTAGQPGMGMPNLGTRW